jgi:hypothetical protein
MKRPCAVLFAAAVLAGCRTAQPTTNPFMRTTVPPPATGQGAPVIPADPYAAPQAMPPAVSPAVPVAPPVAAPPPFAAPPVTAPPRDKYSPPGGSFQYNQSSIDRSKSDAERDQALVRTAAGTSAIAPDTSRDDARPSTRRDPLQQAVWLAKESNSPKAAADREPASRQTVEAITTNAGGEPPERLALTGESGSEIRIVGPSSHDDQDADATTTPASGNPVLRMTVGQPARRAATGATASFREVTRIPAEGTLSQAAIVTSDTVADTTQTPDDQ